MSEKLQLSRRRFIAGLLASPLVALIGCAKHTPTPEPKPTAVVQKPPTATAAPAATKQVSPTAQGHKYKESPILAQKVAKGELPPLEKRLPEEPLVVTPNAKVGETIGRYGGTLHVLEDTPSVHAHSDEGDAWMNEGVATWDFVEKRYAPNVASGWELSPDRKVLTIRLRKGLRWSDGTPFTTEDARFWWEDVMNEPKLTPTLPAQWAPRGKPAKVVVVDAATFRIEYADPNPAALDQLNMVCWAPKHYLSKWHIKYNPDATKLAKDEGYGDWWEAYAFHADRTLQTKPGLPMLSRYILDWSDQAGNKHFVRNPYYWKVDSEGNQLPYIDYYQRNLVGSKEILIAKAVAGEYNFGGAWVGLENYPLLKENEKKGGYTVRLYTPPGGAFGSSVSWCFNYCSKDPVLRQIFNDLRFRQAISYSLNREEYNQIYNLGLAKARQGLPPPSWTFYEEGLDQKYIEYDPDRANRLLDEMGLKWDAKHEYRLRPDGKRLSVFTLDPGGVMRQGLDLVAKWWKAIGIEFIIKPAGQELFREQLLAEELDVGTWGAGGPDEVASHGNFPIRLIPPWHHLDCCALGGSSWRKWWDTKGKAGVEPPPEVKRLLEVWEEWRAEPMGTQKYIQLGKEMSRINAENIWWFIITGLAPGTGNNPTATAVSNKVRNMRDPEAKVDAWIYELLWLEE